MTNAGITVYNDDNKLTVNQTYKNLILKRKIKLIDLKTAEISGEDVLVLDLTKDEILVAVGGMTSNNNMLIIQDYNYEAKRIEFRGVKYSEDEDTDDEILDIEDFRNAYPNVYVYVFGLDTSTPAQSGAAVPAEASMINAQSKDDIFNIVYTVVQVAGKEIKILSVNRRNKDMLHFCRHFMGHSVSKMLNFLCFLGTAFQLLRILKDFLDHKRSFVKIFSICYKKIKKLFMLIDQAEHTPAPLKGTRLPIIFFIIKQLCKFFVKIYLQNDSTFMPNWKQKIFLSHFPCSAKLLSCIIITDIRSILYSKVSCSGGKNHE